MIILLFLIYILVGLLWVYFVHNKIEFNNMLQPVFAIVFWPMHILMYIILIIWD